MASPLRCHALSVQVPIVRAKSSAFVHPPASNLGLPNPSLHLTFASRLRGLPQAGELKLQGLPPLSSK
jgi:hypothetical protein